MGDHHVGAHARLMGQALRKLTGAISKSKTTVIFINQIRMKIGVMFGSPETTTGGNALKFYCSVRLDIRRIGAIKKADGVIGNRTRVKVVKNKVAPPFREAEFDILYGEGISREGELIDFGVDAGIIDKSGAWLSYGDERIGQGRDNAREFLKEHPEIYAEIDRKVLAHFGIGPDAKIEVEVRDDADDAKDAKADDKDSKKASGTPTKAASAKGSGRNSQASA
jgi:recombination protein RecA